MNRFRYALATLILTAGLFTPAVAQKTTADPNIPKLTAQEPDAAKSEAGLSQKVTYTSTDKRLAAVLQELSDKTGVPIHAGTGAANWQVRDLPLIVCAKDMQLSKLLRSIADATHLAFTSSTINGAKHYNIWRTPKREQQLSDYFKTEEERALAKINIEWDSWLKLNQIPDSELPIDTKDEEMAQTLASARSFAKVMTALPAGTKEKVFSGAPVTIKLKKTSGALASAMKDYYRQTWDLRQPAPREELTENLLNSLELSINVSNDDVHSLYLSVSAGYADLFGATLSGDNASELLGASNDLPEKPALPQTEYSPGLHILDLQKTSGLGIEKKIKLDKPKESSPRSFASYIYNLSAASGFSIICEDFLSHKPWYTLEELDESTSETTLKSALQAIQEIAPMKWYIDPARKLIIGSSQIWWEDHISLARESLISGLVKDMNGDGVDIEDVAKTMLLTDKQREAWVFDHKDLFRYEIPERYKAFWTLYAGLSPADRSLAKSEGLPLARLNRAEVIQAFTHCAEITEQEGVEGQSDASVPLTVLYPGLEQRVQTWAMENYPQLSDSDSSDMPSVDLDELFAALLKSFPEIKAALDVPTDPDVIFKLKLKMQNVKQVPADASPEALKPSQYVMTIEGDGVKMLAGGLDLQFPLFSEKRQAELQKEAQEKAKKAATPKPK